MEANPKPVPTLAIKSAKREDIILALSSGWNDFWRNPVISGFFGLVYLVVGYAIIYGLFQIQQALLVIPFAIAFPLIAPFVAAGLYDMSRRYERGEKARALDVMFVIWQQRGRELGWMAFTVLFVFWVWIYQIRLLLAVILSQLSFSSLDRLIEIIFYTSEGWTFIAVGSIIGAVLSTILFSITVIAMPLLLDREVDFITAMITSVKTVLASPAIMLGWGALIGIILIVSMVPAFIGLLISLPVLGHATWHLYKRLIPDREHDL